MEKEKNMLSFYDQNVQQDILQPIRNLLDSGALTLKVDGKITLSDNIVHQRLWLHNRFDPERAACGKWLRIYFTQYQFHPKACRACWKIVLPLDFLADLFYVHNFQAKNDLPAKCGIELRDYSFRKDRYCAFWYVPLGSSEEEAVEILESLRRQLEHKKLKQLLYLKRGCTEIEHAFGRSTLWEKKSQGNDVLEDHLDTIFVDSPTRDKECSLMIPHIARQWIEHAMDIGDPTAKYFTRLDCLPTIDHYTGMKCCPKNGHGTEGSSNGKGKNNNRSDNAEATSKGIIERLA